jgi:hypothetical protein
MGVSEKLRIHQRNGKRARSYSMSGRQQDALEFVLLFAARQTACLLYLMLFALL